MKEYAYQLMQRPYSWGTQPDGEIRYSKVGENFGRIYYDRPLSREEVTNFSLRPITEALDLAGKRFKIHFGPEIIMCDVLNVDENGLISFKIEGEKEEKGSLYWFYDWIGDAEMMS